MLIFLQGRRAYRGENTVNDNENDDDVVFSPPTRRKVENVSKVLNNKENEEGNVTL